MIVFVTNISSGNISGSALSCSKRETASLFHGILLHGFARAHSNCCFVTVNTDWLNLRFLGNTSTLYPCSPEVHS